MQKTLIGLLFITISVLTIGCYTKEKLLVPNPTSYVFDAGSEDVRKAILTRVEDSLDGYTVYAKEDYDNDILSKNIKNDALLRNHYDVKSKMFFRFGNPLPYFPEFIIHLDSISEKKTNVVVYTSDTTIVVGGIGVPHFGYTWEKKVSPSTIEEYEILLLIGQQLGQEGMPECNYTKKWLKYCAKEQEKINKRKEKQENSRYN
ncbi:MAG: hypothetical protein J6X65_05295 [Bacteroidales bacterium]|nr:hypothetical protein [Bacteroidales bacterium]